jgi:hypothetical protein
MLRSLISYIKNITLALTFAKEGKLLRYDIKRYFFRKKKFTNLTINPWNDASYSENERIAALNKAIDWLMYSGQQMKDNGFGSFHINSKWSTSYVETTGYIITSLVDYSQQFHRNDVFDRAVDAAKWLVSVQRPSGGWQGARIADDQPEIVFNTGQVLRGLLSVYNINKDETLLNAARKACDWLCEIQHPEGYWEKNAFLNARRVYDSFVDAPLLAVCQITGDEKYKTAALKNIRWIQTQQNENGWFKNCDNTIKHNDRPILHTISYTIDGLIDSALILNDPSILAIAVKPADTLFDIFNKKKFLNGRFDQHWNGSEYPICTGCAQIAIIWMKLYKITSNLQYLNAALKMNDFLIFVQSRMANEPDNTKGAIPGSFPLWGKYEPFAFPNWATKFFSDSLLLEQECLRKDH